jgi:purine nucleosidase
MGGADRVPGNTAPTTEWNILRPGRRIRRRVARPIASASTSPEGESADHVVELARQAGSTPNDSIALSRGEDRDPVRRKQPHRRFIADALATTWSSLGTTASTAPSSTRWPRPPPSTSLVRTGARRRRGAGRDAHRETVTDWRRVWGRPPNVDVAVEADAEEFLRRFVERVGGLASRLATAQT